MDMMIVITSVLRAALRQSTPITLGALSVSFVSAQVSSILLLKDDVKRGLCRFYGQCLYRQFAPGCTGRCFDRRLDGVVYTAGYLSPSRSIRLSAVR